MLMNSIIYGTKSNKELKEILEIFVDNNSIGGKEYMLDFFGTSLSSWKRWRSGDTRVPHSAINLILSEKDRIEENQEMKKTIEQLKSELLELRSFKSKVSDIVKEVMR